MQKLKELKNSLKNLDRPVLFWSGGLDSTLILAVMRENAAPFDIFQVREMWTKPQRERVDSLIKKWDLQVYSYPMSQAYIIGQGSNISVVFEYAVGNLPFPHLRDVVQGEACLADLAKLERAEIAPMVWATHIIGSRKDDVHYAIGEKQIIPSAKFENKGTLFFCPLYDWTREEVKEALALYGLDNSEAEEAEDTGNVATCHLCLKNSDSGTVFCPKEQKQIPTVKWDAEENLRLFRQRFNFA